MTLSMVNIASKTQTAATKNVAEAQQDKDAGSSFEEQMNDVQTQKESSEEHDDSTALEKIAGFNGEDGQFVADLPGDKLPQFDQTQTIELDETMHLLDGKMGHLSPLTKPYMLKPEKTLDEHKLLSSQFLQNEAIEAELLHKLGTKAGAASDKLVIGSADQPLLSSGEPSAQKVTIADITGLNRQLDSLTARQELPPMTKPFNHPQWQQEFNERILWMHKKAIPSAELRLNPNHLGPISIRIRVDKDKQASIVFNAKHAQVSEAIESALPGLREILSAQQINLVEVNVSSQQEQQTNRQSMQEPQGGGRGSNSEALLADETASNETDQDSVIVTKGLLNLYV